jgi:hypothetical protein
MTTTFSASFGFDMRASLARWGRAAIIGAGCALAALLTGCSALRLGYETAPQLTWWWLDGYFDFERAQAPPVKAAIDGFFAWHRATQLADTAAFLGSTAALAGESITPVTACRVFAQARERLEPSRERALAAAAELLPGLGDAQLRHLEERYAKSLESMREDYLQPDVAKRRAASVKRVVDLAEKVYGKLDEAQRRLVAERVATSPFDPQLWLRERERRQQETLQVLRRLLAEKADTPQRLAALRTLADHAERSPDPAYRGYQEVLQAYNCSFTALLHNATTPAQRAKARERLKGWEADLRSLVPVPAG